MVSRSDVFVGLAFIAPRAAMKAKHFFINLWRQKQSLLINYSGKHSLTLDNAIPRRSKNSGQIEISSW